MTESQFQARLIKKLKARFPGCFVLKNDSSYQQGIPDLTLYWGTHWAQLEVKDSLNAREQPNQKYFVDLFNDMSFAAFICPENEEEVLDAIQEAFESRWRTRVS